jgi:YVTN family beta-propeller protein
VIGVAQDVNSMALTPGKLWAAGNGGDNIGVVDTATNNVTAFVRAGDGPDAVIAVRHCA